MTCCQSETQYVEQGKDIAEASLRLTIYGLDPESGEETVLLVPDAILKSQPTNERG